MLKEIDIEALIPDMFVSELIAAEGSKLPKKKAGMVRDFRIIKKFKEVGITSVVIDTDRGRDVLDIPESDNQIPSSEHNDEPSSIEVPVNEALAGVLGNLIEDRNKKQEYRDLKLEWRTAIEIFTASSNVINSSLDRIKDKAPVSIEFFSQAACAISQSLLRNPDALTWLGKVRVENKYLYEHAVNSAILMGIFSIAAGHNKQQTEDAIAGALLHDLGEALVDESIFYKAGPLTDEEFEEIKLHVHNAEKVIPNFEALPEITKSIIRQHHERCDGTGYPNGLKKDEISVYARMFAIVDSFDAMTTNKTYRQALPSSICMREMLTLDNAAYDEKLLHLFIKSMGIYPTGSLVKLNNGLLAVVIGQNPANALKPLVKLIYNAKTNQYINPSMLDLGRPRDGEKIVSYQDPRDYKLNVIEFMPEEIQWT